MATLTKHPDTIKALHRSARYEGYPTTGEMVHRMAQYIIDNAPVCIMARSLDEWREIANENPLRAGELRGFSIRFSTGKDIHSREVAIDVRRDMLRTKDPTPSEFEFACQKISFQISWGGTGGTSLQEADAYAHLLAEAVSFATKLRNHFEGYVFDCYSSVYSRRRDEGETQAQKIVERFYKGLKQGAHKTVDLTEAQELDVDITEEFPPGIYTEVKYNGRTFTVDIEESGRCQVHRTDKDNEKAA